MEMRLELKRERKRRVFLLDSKMEMKKGDSMDMQRVLMMKVSSREFQWER
jgi:hypothetical protein